MVTMLDCLMVADNIASHQMQYSVVDDDGGDGVICVCYLMQ